LREEGRRSKVESGLMRMNLGEGSGYMKKYIVLTNIKENNPVKKPYVTRDGHIV
jgi:hypothetical protein